MAKRTDIKQMKRLFIIIRLITIRSGWKKAKLLKEKQIFHTMGNNCYYHPFKLPAEPHLISIGNNVFIGTNVTMVTHNMINCVFNNMSEYKLPQGIKGIPIVGVIVLGSNVFVGANSTILYNVHIGNNCIIGANSVVTKDVKDGTVVAGCPAKVIGTFDQQFETYRQFIESFHERTSTFDMSLWDKHNKYFWER